jgi:glutamate dehydrogenase
LLEAFPEPMRVNFRAEILSHRLRNEIVATELANRIVNRLGVIHPFELAEEEGASLDQVAAAFACAADLFGAGELWHRLETAKMPEAARLRLFDRAALAMRGHMADLLRAGAGIQPPSQLVADLAKGIAELATKKDELLRAEAKYHSARLKDEFEAAGAPAREAAMVAHLFDMDGAAGLARLAADTGIAPAKVTHAFTDLGERLGLDWAQGYAAVMSPSDPWERLLVAGLARDFQQMRLDLLRRLAKGKGRKADPSAEVEKWTATHDAAIAQFRAMTARAQRSASVTPAVLAQIAGQARNLLGR